MSYTLRWRWRQLGDHIHVRVFVVKQTALPKGGLSQNAGNLTFRAGVEWAAIVAKLADRIEMVAEVES